MEVKESNRPAMISRLHPTAQRNKRSLAMALSHLLIATSSSTELVNHKEVHMLPIKLGAHTCTCMSLQRLLGEKSMHSEKSVPMRKLHLTRVYGML